MVDLALSESRTATQAFSTIYECKQISYPQSSPIERKANNQMGIIERKDGAEVLYLLPEQIKTDEKFNVRPYSDGEDSEAVERLAASIERDGQIDAGVVIPVKKDGSSVLDDDESESQYTLIAGHRRRRAISLLNQKYSASGQPLLKMRVTIDRSGGDHVRKAISSNLHRTDFSPMDLAALITRIRTDNGWQEQGFAAVKKIAAYLGISTAQVTQHERFTKADKDLQQKLHSGVLSAQSAFDLLSVSPEKRAEVLARAEEIQAASDEAKSAKSKKAGKNVDSTVPKIPVPPTSNKAEAAPETPAKKRIERPAVVKAIRTVAADDNAKTAIPRTRKEIVEFFAQLDGPAYGYPDSSTRQFIAYFIEKWVPGKGSDKTLLAKFDAMTAKADKGTKQAEKASEPEKPAKSGKKAAKPAKAEKPAKLVKKSAPKKSAPKTKKSKTPETVAEAVA